MISARLVTRYVELKREAPGCVLLMQVGAFMKVLNDDARSVSEVTGLKLPSRTPAKNATWKR